MEIAFDFWALCALTLRCRSQLLNLNCSISISLSMSLPLSQQQATSSLKRLSLVNLVLAQVPQHDVQREDDAHWDLVLY